jgi:hypothetical protein
MKKEWMAYLLKLEAYYKSVKKWVKKLPDGEITAQDGPGSNPPGPPPPPPTNP